MAKKLALLQKFTRNGKTMGVTSRFLLCLGIQSKEAGDKGNLSSSVSFWHSMHLSLPNQKKSAI